HEHREVLLHPLLGPGEHPPERAHAPGPDGLARLAAGEPPAARYQFVEPRQHTPPRIQSAAQEYILPREGCPVTKFKPKLTRKSAVFIIIAAAALLAVIVLICSGGGLDTPEERAEYL